jgi:hypothetical protein
MGVHERTLNKGSLGPLERNGANCRWVPAFPALRIDTARGLGVNWLL